MVNLLKKVSNHEKRKHIGDLKPDEYSKCHIIARHSTLNRSDFTGGEFISQSKHSSHFLIGIAAQNFYFRSSYGLKECFAFSKGFL